MTTKNWKKIFLKLYLGTFQSRRYENINIDFTIATEFWQPCYAKFSLFCKKGSTSILTYCKIPKISPGALGGGALYFWRGLSTEGNFRFKTDWASLIIGSKFTFFALFYFVVEGNFPSTSPLRASIWRGDLTEGFLRYRFGGLIF